MHCTGESSNQNRCCRRARSGQSLNRGHKLASLFFFSLSHRTSSLEECQQVGIEPLLVSLGEAVGRACVDLESRVPDEFRRGKSGGADQHDLVVVAVHDEASTEG